MAQVVIQEEVVLDTQLEVESVSLTMPFYGQVSGCVNWGAIWNGGLKDVVITAGNQTKTMGFGCLAGYVYCTWYIQNVPLDTDVDITVYGSCEDGQLIEAETQLISTGTNEYSVEYYDIWGNWTLATTVKFTATTPPGCDYACQSSLDKEMPETFVAHVDPSETVYNECGNQLALGGFRPASSPSESSNLWNLQISDVDACYDMASLKWTFELHPDSVSLNVVKTLCWDNIALLNSDTTISSVSEIDLLPDRECSVLQRAIMGFEKVPLSDDIRNSYVFTEILYAHENEHEKDWLEYVNRFYDNYLNIPNKINFNDCLAFTSDNAKIEYLGKLKGYFWTDFFGVVLSEYCNDHYLYKGDNEEEQLIIDEERLKLDIALHARKGVQDVWSAYRDKIISKCGEF